VPLAQTTDSKKVLRQLDALARSTGRTRAGYLRWLVEMHTQVMTPKLEQGLRPAFLPGEKINPAPSKPKPKTR